jgi:hypothetical protein
LIRAFNAVEQSLTRAGFHPGHVLLNTALEQIHSPRTMQDPDEEQDGSEQDEFEEALEKLPPEELNRTLQETFMEMHAHALLSKGTPLWFPPEVLERLIVYEKEHSLERNKLIPLAMKVTKGRVEEVIETMQRYMADPGSFEWQIEDPLLCVAIAFMRSTTIWWAKKINEEYGDDDEPADWWKMEE